MKTIGLIGGMSWESTVPYYRQINEAIKAALGGLHSAKIVLYSVDFHDVEQLQQAGDWEAAGVIVHDVKNRSVAHMLIDLRLVDGFPIALGVIFDDPRPTFDSAVIAQNVAVSKGKTPDLQGLLAKGQTWTVEKENTVFV